MVRGHSRDTAAETPVKRHRQTHRKSRNGCRVCKSRHTKCDELRPACRNCTITGRQCSYADSSPQPSTESPASTTPPSCDSPALSINSQASIPSLLGAGFETAGSANVFDLTDFALFYYAQNNMADFLLPDKLAHTMSKDVLECALTAPYLMNQLLALTALYLGKCHPERQEYIQRATTLQNRALSSFNTAKQSISDETCVPMFLFSSLLGLHVLCDTLHSQRQTFGHFLDRFTEYLSLHRGVNAITSHSWGAIKRSPLGTFLTQTESAFDRGVYYQGEVDVLVDMVNDSDISEAHRQLYNETLASLKDMFAGHHGLIVKNRSPFEAPLGFPVRVKPEYIECLRKRRPEALVILAFYAVMLHWNRALWAFDDGGEYLIRSISAYLGPHWIKWLAWPMSMLESEYSNSANSRSPQPMQVDTDKIS